MTDIEPQQRLWAAYTRLWRTEAFPALLSGFILARLPTGMVALSMTLATLQATGSMALTGLVAASEAIAMGVGMPLTGRAVDRYGPRRVFVVTGMVYPLALLTFAAIALGFLPAHPAFLAAAAAFVGASIPPVAPVVRTLWTERLSPSDLSTMNALESAIAHSFYLVGPAVVGLLALTGEVAYALVAAAVLNAAGVALVATSRAVVSLPTRSARAPLAAVFAQRGMGPLLAAMFGFALALEALEFSVIGWADDRDAPGLAGIVLAVSCAGALASAALLGTGTRILARVTLPTWFVLWAAAMVPLWLSVAVGAPTVVVIGAAVVARVPSAAALALLLGAACDVAAPGLRTETFAWRLTANLSGAAAGASLCGFGIELVGPAGAAVFGVVCAVAAAAVARRLTGLSSRGEEADGARAVGQASPSGAVQPVAEAS